MHWRAAAPPLAGGVWSPSFRSSASFRSRNPSRPLRPRFLPARETTHELYMEPAKVNEKEDDKTHIDRQVVPRVSDIESAKRQSRSDEYSYVDDNEKQNRPCEADRRSEERR